MRLSHLLHRRDLTKLLTPRTKVPLPEVALMIGDRFSDGESVASIKEAAQLHLPCEVCRFGRLQIAQ